MTDCQAHRFLNFSKSYCWIYFALLGRRKLWLWGPIKAPGILCFFLNLGQQIPGSESFIRLPPPFFFNFSPHLLPTIGRNPTLIHNYSFLSFFPTWTHTNHIHTNHASFRSIEEVKDEKREIKDKEIDIIGEC